MILTFDVEEWYDATAIRPYVQQPQSRLKEQMKELLWLLKQRRTKATFFVLGERAKEHPDIVEQIINDGHEVGTHGNAHNTPLTNKEFEKDLSKSIKTLKKAGADSIKGFRAPDFRIIAPEAMKICARKGIEYSSNHYWLKHHKPPKGLKEVPITTGGAYLRLMPWSITKKILSKHEHPTVYIHPWELDTKLPRVQCPYYTHQRHYGNIHTMKKKLKLLLQ